MSETIRSLHFSDREKILTVVEVFEKELWLRDKRKKKTLKDRYSYVEVGDVFLVPIDGLLLGANRLGKEKNLLSIFHAIQYLIRKRTLNINFHVNRCGEIAYLAIPPKIIKQIKDYYPKTFGDN